MEQTTIYFRCSAIYADADDNKFVDCAMNGRAHFLVTNDKHFDVQKHLNLSTIPVLRTQSFLQRLLKEDDVDA